MAKRKPPTPSPEALRIARLLHERTGRGADILWEAFGSLPAFQQTPEERGYRAQDKIINAKLETLGLGGLSCFTLKRGDDGSSVGIPTGNAFKEARPHLALIEHADSEGKSLRSRPVLDPQIFPHAQYGTGKAAGSAIVSVEELKENLGVTAECNLAAQKARKDPSKGKAH